MSATTSSSSFEGFGASAKLPKSMRLGTQRWYERVEPVVGAIPPPTSTFDAPGSHSLTVADATPLCVASRQSVGLGSMVQRVIHTIPPHVVEAIHRGPAPEASLPPELAPSAAAAGAEAAGAGGASNASPLPSSSPSKSSGGAARLGEDAPPPPTMAALAEILDREPRRGIKGAMVSEFFSGGSLDGPFPGAKSVQGEWMASTFFKHARPLDGMPKLDHVSPYSPSGYRLKRT